MATRVTISLSKKTDEFIVRSPSVEPNGRAFVFKTTSAREAKKVAEARVVQLAERWDDVQRDWDESIFKKVPKQKAAAIRRSACKPANAERQLGVANIPYAHARANIKRGDLVKLLLPGEQLWVRTTAVVGSGTGVRSAITFYRGVLSEPPRVFDSCEVGDEIEFDSRHVAGIEKKRAPSTKKPWWKFW